MNAAFAERPRAVTVIDRVGLILALFRVGGGLLGLLVWRVGSLGGGIPLFRMPAP